MKILQTINKVLDTAVEKNQKAAAMRRLKNYIKANTAAMRYEYMRLGKYYYENLNLSGNGQADALCKNIDELKDKIAHAQRKISQINNNLSLCCEKSPCVPKSFIYETEQDEESEEPEPTPPHPESKLTYLWESLQESPSVEESFDSEEAAPEPVTQESTAPAEPENGEEQTPESAPFRIEELYLINDSKEAADDEDGMIIPMPNLPPQ